MGDKTQYKFTQNDAGLIGHAALDAASACLKHARLGTHSQREEMLTAMHKTLIIAEQVRQIMQKPVKATRPPQDQQP